MVSEELDAALDACVEHDRLSQQLGDARLDEYRARQAAQEAAAAVQAEQRDVEELQSFGPTRIWASLHGDRQLRLDRDRADLESGQVHVSETATALAVATAAREQLEKSIAALGDVRARRSAAIDAEEARLLAAGGSVAAQLQEVSGQLAGARAELAEVAEAKAAAREAERRLEDAAELLASAASWAGVDVFMGGGILTDLAKYDRMDAANERLQAADQALKRFSAELGDVGLQAVGGIEVSDLDRTFDVWFDNVFSDWSVRQRIAEAAERTERAQTAVASASDRLLQREAELDTLQGTLTHARETLILGQ